MKNPLPAGSTIGIIGGGQLGRMLGMAAARLGYKTIVLEPQADCPAAVTCGQHIQAAYDDAEALQALGAACDVVTYEFENVPVEAMRRLSQAVAVLPPPAALDVAQDRLAEKDFLNRLGLSTAPYRAVDNDAELAAALAAFEGSGVLKTRRMGYDGKGQRVFRSAELVDLDGTYASMGNVPLILEGFVAFEREVSVIAARGENGEVAAFDLAENIHRDGILRSSTVPASIGETVAESARQAAFRILEALDYVGVIGVEFFALADGALLINEIAPRVHNSGHWTEAACAVSQFEQHIRAISGQPLGDIGRHSDCVMENLIGDEVLAVPALLAEPNLVLHLYGKSKSRPGRKMGHFTRLKPKR